MTAILEDSFEKMDELLCAWNLPQLCQVFRDQEINIDALEALTEADIMELIPKVGPRAIFRKRLNEWINSEEYEIHEERNEMVLENDDIKYVEVETIDDNESNASDIYITNELASSNEVKSKNRLWTENITEDNPSEEQSINGTDEDCIGVDFLEEYNDEVGPKTPKQTEIPKTKDLKENKNVNYLTKLEENDKSYQIGEEINDSLEVKGNDEATANRADIQRYMNVQQILLSTKKGKTIIENYEQTPHINKSTRLYIADLIVSEAFAKNLMLDQPKFMDIASQIVELFPNEDIKTWFVARSGSSRNSGGTLFNKYYTVYRRMRKTGFYDNYLDGVIKHFDIDSIEGDNNLRFNPEQIDDAPEKSALKRAIPKYERLRRSCDFERINVKTLLESSFEGRGIIEHYEKNAALDVQTRNRLCKLVVLEASQRNIKMRPRNFYDISCQIVDLFPSETIDMYFLPRGRTPPKGCLYHKYLYIKRCLRKMGEQNKRQERFCASWPSWKLHIEI